MGEIGINLYEENGAWFYRLEGQKEAIGPFETEKEAREDLEAFFEATFVRAAALALGGDVV